MALVDHYVISQAEATAKSSAFGTWLAATSTYALAVKTTAGSFTIGYWYTILTVGTTDFTAIGSANNNVGTSFLCSGVGSGTGTAYVSCLLSEALAATTGAQRGIESTSKRAMQDQPTTTIQGQTVTLAHLRT